MTIKEAIEKAIEGGWNLGGFINLDRFPNGFGDARVGIGHYVAISRIDAKGNSGRWVELGIIEEIILDPLFWTALGKAMQWGAEVDAILGTKQRFHPPQITWLFHWHRLIDHLAKGKDIESFFERL